MSEFWAKRNPARWPTFSTTNPTSAEGCRVGYRFVDAAAIAEAMPGIKVTTKARAEFSAEDAVSR